MKMNQILKIGIFVLIVISSFLIFPKIGKAWCCAGCYQGAPWNMGCIDECNGGITPNCDGCGWRGYWVPFPTWTNVGYLCKSGTCWEASPNAWTKGNKFPDASGYNGQPCGVIEAGWGLDCHWNGQGVWDASERKCVQCDGGKFEKKVCGSAGTVSTDACNAGLTYCISPGCTVEGNKKCETACDINVSPKCDDKAPGTPGNPGDPCGNGGHCDENCQCVGEVVPPQCSDGIDNDGDGKIDFPADPGCTDASDNDETDIAGLCKTGPTYTCPAAMKCPTCPEELIGGLVPCGRTCDDPCTAECECAPCTLCHLFVLFKRIVDFATINILFPLAVLMIVVGGVMFLTAAGDPGRIGTAKKILSSVAIGLLIIFLAWLIVDTIIMFITKSDSPFRNWKEIDCPLPEEITPPPSGCICTDWVNVGCGAGGCFPTEMYKTRTCPDDCDKETDCFPDVACGAQPPPGCLLNPPNCLLCP
jgi:hypothetical protein